MRTLALISATLLVMLTAMPVGAVTIETTFEAGNLFYGRDRGITDETLFDESYLFGGSASIAAPVSDNTRLTVGFARDHVLRNYAFLRFAHTGPIATIAVGPVLGIANNPNTWYYVTPGVYSLLRAELGTLGYASFSSISSGFLALDDEGDSNQSSYTATLGFYGAGLITSLYLENRAFTTLTPEGREEDSATAYGLRVETFKKNVGYRITLDFAYTSYKRNYIAGDTTRLHNIGSLVVTPRIDLTLPGNLVLGIGAENGLYTFGLDYLLGEFSPNAYFFNAFVDLSLRMGE
jgi:hypothetical protein